jgi:hypothetical protein
MPAGYQYLWVGCLDADGKLVVAGTIGDVRDADRRIGG